MKCEFLCECNISYDQVKWNSKIKCLFFHISLKYSTVPHGVVHSYPSETGGHLGCVIRVLLKRNQRLSFWPWVCNYLMCCSNGPLTISWTSISKGMEIVVRLVPCLLFLLSLSSLLSSLPHSLSFRVWIANSPRRGPGRDKVAARCSFPPVLFLTIALVQGCCCEQGGGDGAQWPRVELRTDGFPYLVANHNMSGTQDISIPNSPFPLSLTPGHRWAVFLRKWRAIWSERPHICPANEKAGGLPTHLPEHCPYPHRSRPPSNRTYTKRYTHTQHRHSMVLFSARTQSTVTYSGDT